MAIDLAEQVGVTKECAIDDRRLVFVHVVENNYEALAWAANFRYGMQEGVQVQYELVVVTFQCFANFRAFAPLAATNHGYRGAQFPQIGLELQARDAELRA